MGNIESTMNASVAEVLDGMRETWRASPEQTGALARGRPDIIIHEPGCRTVIIETEFEPARTVDQDAKARIGVEDRKSGRPVRVAIAVKVPCDLQHMDPARMRQVLRQHKTKLKYAVYDPVRYPLRGWIEASLADMAFAVQLLSVPIDDIREIVARMEDSVKRICDIIERLDAGTQDKIVERLNQANNRQAWGMASMILLNAMMFYDDIVGTYEKTKTGVKTISKNKISGHNTNTVKIMPIASLETAGHIAPLTLRRAWGDVLEINYYPIFRVAMDILAKINEEAAADIIEELMRTMSQIKAAKLSKSADLYGTLLQRLIPDRARLASYYTRPESAALMAAVAIPPPGSRIYESDGRMRKFLMADFACGTGLLLTSAYRLLLSNYEAVQKTRENPIHDLHPYMLANCIMGLDVLPTATHLTVSTLAGMFPKIMFNQTRIHTMPFGLQNKAALDYRLGSCDLMDDSHTTLFESSRQITGSGETGSKHTRIADESVELIVMNPPFTRSGKDKSVDAAAPWAAFGTAKEDQKIMGKLIGKKFRNTCYHGHAGLGSAFLAVGDKKLRPGGTMCLILPATLAFGESWSEARSMLARDYNITVISMARPGMGNTDGAFSSDTGMGEVMLFANKAAKGSSRGNGRFVTLYERPESVFKATQTGVAIKNMTAVNRLEQNSGPTSIRVGDKEVGSAMDCRLDDRWPLVTIYDMRIVQEAYRIQDKLKFTVLGKACKFGNDSQMLIGKVQKGPFGKHDIDLHVAAPTYAALWNNNSESQKKLIVDPDTKLEVLPKRAQRAREIWLTEASNIHVNTDIRYTSQSLLAAYTVKKTAGGRSWPSVILPGNSASKAMAAWLNTTFGAIFFWLQAGRQQLGRGLIKRSGMGLVSIPDIFGIKTDKMEKLAGIFDEFSDRAFLPVNKLNTDPVRKELDAKVSKTIGIYVVDEEQSGLDEFSVPGGYRVAVNLDLLRNRFCMEPTICGKPA